VNEKDQQLKNWLATLAMDNGNWPLLKQLAHKSKNPIWKYVAQSNLDEKAKFPKDECLKFLKLKDINLESTSFKTCQDKKFVDLLKYLHQKNNDYLFTNFFRSLEQIDYEKNLAKENLSNYLIWDLNEEVTIEPTLTELVLNLPKNKKIKSRADRELKK
jgi:hypothetical protein